MADFKEIAELMRDGGAIAKAQAAIKEVKNGAAVFIAAVDDGGFARR